MLARGLLQSLILFAKSLRDPGGREKLTTEMSVLIGKWIVETQLDVEIPANTKAPIYIPANSAESVMESNVALSSAKDIKLTGKEGNYVVVEVGSGKYHFNSSK